MNAHKRETYTAGSLLSQMEVDVCVNQQDICVLYDKELPFFVRNIEFHNDSGELTFNGDNGVSQALGLPAPNHLRAQIAAADTIHLFRVELEPKKFFKSHDIIPLLQKD